MSARRETQVSVQGSGTPPAAEAKATRSVGNVLVMQVGRTTFVRPAPPCASTPFVPVRRSQRPCLHQDFAIRRDACPRRRKHRAGRATRPVRGSGGSAVGAGHSEQPDPQVTGVPDNGRGDDGCPPAWAVRPDGALSRRSRGTNAPGAGRGGPKPFALRRCLHSFGPCPSGRQASRLSWSSTAPRLHCRSGDMVLHCCPSGLETWGMMARLAFRLREQ